MNKMFTAPWTKVSLKFKAQDEPRIEVLDHMIQKLIEILKRVKVHSFHEIVAPLCQLTLLSKHLTDTKPTLSLYQMLGCLFLNLGKKSQALKLFDVARDISHDSQNLAQELLCYEWLGRTLQESGEFSRARIAFKKMLQLAWVTNIQDYEFRAYKQIAKQYFYLNEVDKSNGYSMKALLGDIEQADSHPRVISEEHYWYKTRMATNQGKFERMGLKVFRKDAKKKIVAT